jgi:hypothetical protein
MHWVVLLVLAVGALGVLGLIGFGIWFALSFRKRANQPRQDGI